MVLDALFPAKLNSKGLADIQGLILRLYRLQYGRFIFLRFDDAEQGRQWLKQIASRVTSVTDWDRDGATTEYTWNVAFTYNGLKALGVPDASLETFSEEFRVGMAARADYLGDTGDSAPDKWDDTLGINHGGIHAVLILYATDNATCEREDAWHRSILSATPKVVVIHDQDVGILPTEREHFGYRDGIGAPAVEGSGLEPLPGQDVLRAGEFILGYTDESGHKPPQPQPDMLGRHGSYMVVRKLKQDVAGFRAFLKSSAAALGLDEELLAAKMMGRWRSGAPLALSPDHDDPELGADPQRNNDFGYRETDPRGLACPAGSHIRRTNARDDEPEKIAKVKRHRVRRGGITYGPLLPEGADDDGVDRGLVFVFFGASIERQFEFVQTIWSNDGDFLRQGTDKDPISGANDGTTNMVIPRHPVRLRLKGIPRFVTTRGGGYFFMPSMTALDYLAEGSG
jgi:Dyp-type peroxidase family